MFEGIYRDDGLMVMSGMRSQVEVLHWLSMFQRRVDATLGSDRLQFTKTMWRAYEQEPVQMDPKLVILSDPVFLLLDMLLSWNRNGCLSFSAFHKPNQELK